MLLLAMAAQQVTARVALEVSGPGGLRGSPRIPADDLQVDLDRMRAPVDVVLR